MPLAGWVIVLGVALILIGVWVLITARRVDEIGWYRCSRCGYRLEILAHQRCPECGAELDRGDLEPPTDERRSFRTAVGACLIFFGMLIGAWGSAGLVG